MRNIIPPEIRTIFLDDPESEKKLRTAYHRVFTIAHQNLIQKKLLRGLGKDNKEIKKVD